MFFRIKIYRVSLVCLMLVILDSSSALAQMTNLSIPPTEPAEPDFLVVPDISDERLLEESAYRLGAGDVLNIDIFRVPQYSGNNSVLVGGTLSLPLVGDVNVDGLTLSEAASVLSERYGTYLRRPIVTVSLVENRPLRIGIAGEILQPGAYAINGTGAALPRLTQLLETAGGTTQAADIRQVKIRRRGLDGTYEIIQTDLWALLQTGDQSRDITLRDGDSIYVPTAVVPLSESALLADASFAGDVGAPINIAVVGEVYRPGPYTLRGGQARIGDAGVSGSSGGCDSPTTVTRALHVAGGIKPEADIRRVQVSRPTRSGSAQVFDVDLWQLLASGDLQQDAILQEGDTIVVPMAAAVDPESVPAIASASFSPNAIRVNVVGETERTGTIELSPDTSLSQAVLAAGGFNNRANEVEAELIRLNPDGTVSRRLIPVDFASGIDEETNPLLRNDDVVVVNPSLLANVDDTVSSILGPVGRVIQSIFFPLRLLNVFD